MSSSDIAVFVRGLSKAYTIAHDVERHNTLAEALLSRIRTPLGRPNTETFWALKDVSFDIKKGNVLGIIGRNGAGKSTLLKILSRITEPTTGEIDIEGRVGSLLEVGTGFHPELSGRENIYLNGAILGMSKAEIRKQFDAIVAFADVEQFLDTPVKRYSSGMYVRLAFAVAAHMRSEVLIVDEVLAVGDADFQKRCIGKMQDVASEEGRTVLFVSHNLGSIASLCSHGVTLDKGRLQFDGTAREAVNYYVRKIQASESVLQHKGVVLDISFLNPSGAKMSVWELNTEMIVRCQVKFDRTVIALALDLAFYSPNGARVFSVRSDRITNELAEQRLCEAIVEFRIKNVAIACPEVSVDVGIRVNHDPVYYHWWQRVNALPIATSVIPVSYWSEDTVCCLPCDIRILER